MKETEETRRENENNKTNNIFSVSSSVFKNLHWIYLIAYAFVQAGDTLPSAYRYAILANYNLSRSTIEKLSVISHSSSMLIGTFSASLSDRYGRRFICLASSFGYILKNITFNFPILWFLIIGHISWGIGSAAQNTGFEAWLFQECRERRLDMLSVRRILRNSFLVFSLLAIINGFSSQFLVNFGGYTLPFNVSSILFVSSLFFIWEFWTENYGIKHTNTLATFAIAIRVIRADPRIVILGMCSALFEAALHIFIVEWTPTLQRTSTSSLPIGLGIIYGLMWIFELVGVCLFEPLSKLIREQTYMIVVFILACVGLSIPSVVPNSFVAILAGFLVFEICTGIFRPTMSALRSLYYPNEVRVTIMNYMRVPQMILMLIVLLSHFQLRTIWIICICFIFIAMLCMIILRNLKMPEERVNVEEMDLLLDNVSLSKINQSELPVKSDQ